MSTAVSIRELHQVPEFEQCVRLQRSVWGFQDIDLVPRRMFVVADATGGHVIGAFAGEQLAGYVLGLPGFHERPGGARRLYLHSHMLAVAPAVRDCGIGRRLKLRQRELALERGIDLIEWTFDPLEIKNGHFNIARLGVVARRYLPNLYGTTSSALQGGLPTDRLLVEWWLASDRVTSILDGQPQSVEAERRIPVPVAIADWKASGDAGAAAAQSRIREQLQSAFSAGLAVTGYDSTPGGDGVFLLSRFEPHED